MSQLSARMAGPLMVTLCRFFLLALEMPAFATLLRCLRFCLGLAMTRGGEV